MRAPRTSLKWVASISALCLVAVLVTMFIALPQRDSSSPSTLMKWAESMRGGDLQIGVGIYDVTGPAAEVNMMGYALASQTSAGIHIRVYSRAFVFVDPDTGKRFAFVTFDGGMGSDIVTRKVVERLQSLYPGMYSIENVCLSGTHTHSAPAGFLQYTLFQITSLGYVQQSADAFVEGIAQSIVMAHKNVRPAVAYVGQDLLEGANINRSPTSYMANPEEERLKYLNVGNDTDHNMVLVKMLGTDGTPLGSLNWFAVHGTSMNNTNKLISGDNKGYAAQLVEKYMNTRSLVGKGPFVAGFGSTNLGDISPNTKGPRCMDSGLPCDVLHSTCNGKNEMCVASGPGKDMFESTEIIGRLQAEKAKDLFRTADLPLTGPVQYVHQFVHMPSVQVNGVNLCTPAMGYAFAAGTTDGCGMFNFQQGTNSSNPFWDLVSHLLAKPSKETEACHAPKPILLDTGDVKVPYEWDPQIVPIQILRVGRLVILGISGELTTMAGRRLRNAVKDTLISKGVLDSSGIVVIAGLANSYSSYITTYEEYQRQRYEAASTLYGPHTLEGYIQLFTELAVHLADGTPVDPGPTPPNYESKQISLLPPVIHDGHPSGTPFGTVLHDAAPTYTRNSRVLVSFQSANPRNNLRTQDTFLEVQLETDGQWTTIATDADWETQYRWAKHGSTIFADQSFVDIIWDIPSDAVLGNYRIVHHGDSRDFLQVVKPFSGISRTFEVTA